MAYSDFKLSEIIQKFELTLNEVSGLFADVPEEEPSNLLTTILKENVDLAVSINTEKARSEMIISPILLEVRRKLNNGISLFSGVDFNDAIKIVYGAVTIGTIWQFLKLEDKTISIDLTEYYIKDVKKILGILISAIMLSTHKQFINNNPVNP
jgi:hypothetical protein